MKGLTRRIAILGGVCGVAGCTAGPSAPKPIADDESSARLRLGKPRGLETIFTPPPLPPPTEVRLATGAPGPAYWQNRADYRIEASLDPATDRITGRAWITYRNNSPHELEHLWLHLEQNLYDPASEGSRTTVPGARWGNRHQFHGGVEDLRVTLAPAQAGGEGAPADLRVYGTLARLDLPRPLGPNGGVVELEVSWSFVIPPYGSDRMGIERVRGGTVYQIGQWFPAVAKYDDTHGWNTLPYLGQGEFYTDFGSYDVRLTLPREFVAVATGSLENAPEVLTPEQIARLERASRGREPIAVIAPDEVGARGSRPPGSGDLIWRFRADDARTFAWACSDAWVWDAAAATGPGVGGPGRDAVLCQSVYPKEALGLWGQGRATAMVRDSVEFYSRRFAPYPYPNATNVNGAVTGMEYPGIVFCGEREAERALWGVVTHEIAHAWFPMTVNTDERRHAWMDEGFVSFMNALATAERYPEEKPWAQPRIWAREMDRPLLQPIATSPDRLIRGTLGPSQYRKAAVGLTLLRDTILGPERFDAAFDAYIRRWAFKSPQPADFFRTVEDVAGTDLGWFWRGWFYETGLLDQAVTNVLQPSGAGGGTESRNARVTFENRGELVMPLVYRVTYDDGGQETRSLPVQAWHTTDAWTATWDTGGRRIRRVVVDPDEEFPDVAPGNNVWSR